jgi:curli biogenesis system outer membrane secretion channel CsgG
MIRIRTIVFLVLALLGASLYAQTKPRLGILPFTGGSGRDGDTIASLFSNSEELDRTFVVVPRTSSVEAIMREQQFQRTGLTDSDTIAELGKQMNADYVVSGHITRLGKENLLLISIVNVKTMEQIAGDYKPYATIGKIRDLLPDMAKSIIASVQQKDSVSGGELAVLPLNIQNQGVNQDDAETLAQILATEIANTHRYAVLPRTKTIETVMEEQHIQRSGLTDRDGLVAIGKATNARYVLAGTITKLDTTNLFLAQILDIESGIRIKGRDLEYVNLEDGIEIMQKLALNLTGITEEEEAREREQEQQDAELRQEQERRNAEFRQGQEKAEARRKRLEAGRWDNSFDIGVIVPIPLGVGVSISYAFSFLPYTFFDIGLDGGMTTRNETDRWGSDVMEIYPLADSYAHVNGFLPLGKIKLFAGVGTSYIFTSPAILPPLDVTAGIYFFSIGKLAYTRRIPLKTLDEAEIFIEHCISLGFSF